MSYLLMCRRSWQSCQEWRRSEACPHLLMASRTLSTSRVSRTPSSAPSPSGRRGCSSSSRVEVDACCCCSSWRPLLAVAWLLPSCWAAGTAVLAAGPVSGGWFSTLHGRLAAAKVLCQGRSKVTYVQMQASSLASDADILYESALPNGAGSPTCKTARSRCQMTSPRQALILCSTLQDSRPAVLQGPDVVPQPLGPLRCRPSCLAGAPACLVHLVPCIARCMCHLDRLQEHRSHWEIAVDK